MLRDARPVGATATSSASRNARAACDRGLARREGGLQRSRCADLHQVWDERQLAICAPARQPGLRRRRTRARPATPTIPGLHVAPRRSTRQRRRRGAVPATWRAPEGRDPARAGRQLARRDGLRVHQAGFEPYDVHMTDLQAGRARLADFQGFVAVRRLHLRRHAGRRRRLGRSDPVQRRSWPSSSRPSSRRADTFALGVCNGCQMMAALADIIPGAAGLAALHRATAASSSRRGCRMVEVLESPSIFFAGMAGSRLPIAVAHGEGYRRLLAARRRGRGASRRCASSTTTASRPRPIRSTRTAAPAA